MNTTPSASLKTADNTTHTPVEPSEPVKQHTMHNIDDIAHGDSPINMAEQTHSAEPYLRVYEPDLIARRLDTHELPLAVFWDMDGTLINSEPYWHDGEIEIARAHGGEWTEEMGWKCTGIAVPKVAQVMIDHGTHLSVQEIHDQLIAYVARREQEHMPWIPGAREALELVAGAGIPSVLVTSSPRHVARELVKQAPQGVFGGYVCGDDVHANKPDPDPYQQAARVLGIDPGDAQIMARCVAFEDSGVGLQSATAAGTTVLALTGYIDTPDGGLAGPCFDSIATYDELSIKRLRTMVERRLA